MQIIRKGFARWWGGFRDGHGTITTQSGALSSYPYAVASRFEGQAGTNPEELLGAAHAGCFTMALSSVLADAKLTADEMETSAHVTLEAVAGGYAITAVHLTLKAKIAGIDQVTFDSLTLVAKTNCPVSKVLNAAVTLDAQLSN